MNLKEAMKDYKRYDFEVVVTKTYKIEVHEKTHEEAKKALMFAWMNGANEEPVETVISIEEVNNEPK
jgi:hypothetical protein